MTVTERVAYLKGLTEGLDIDSATKEGKLLKAIVDVLDDISFELSDTQEIVGELSEQVDMIDEDLEAVEKIVYDDEDEEDEDEDELFEVTCPNCGDTIYLDDEMLDMGEIECPNCGENLEFDFDDCDCECDCDDDCDCGCHHDKED